MLSHRLLPPELIVVAAGIGAAMHIGKLPPALPMLSEALGLNLLSSGFLLSMIMLAGVTLGVIIGATADTLGPRRALLSGLLILSISSMAGGFANTSQQLLLARACEGLGFLLIVLPAPGLIRQLVTTDRLSRRLGWWASYMGLGIGSTLLLGPPWLSAFGWRSWWWLISLISLALFALALWGIPTLRPAPKQGSMWLNHIRATLRNRGSWLVAITFSLYAAQWMAIVGFLPTLYTQAGYDSWQLGLFTAGVAFANIGGNLLAGQLIHRGLSPFTVIALGFVIKLCTAWIAFAVLEPGPMQIFCILLFSGLGGLVPGSLFYVALKFAPAPQTMSSNIGWIQQWISSGQFFGPPLLAFAVGWSGQWSISWVVTGSLAVLGLLMTVLMWRHQHRLNAPSSSSTS